MSRTPSKDGQGGTITPNNQSILMGNNSSLNHNQNHCGTGSTTNNSSNPPTPLGNNNNRDGGKGGGTGADGARRTHTIMTAEEAATGKRSNWSELEITGNVRNLAPSLFDLTHLTHLFVNDNSLTKLPPDIGRLVNLQVLDASNNKLRSLPPEIGDLRRLRELFLNNNYLRNFPFEMGKLFKLQILRISGNPLPADLVSLQAEVNGTSKLLTYLLDSIPDLGFFIHPIWPQHTSQSPDYTIVRIPKTNKYPTTSTSKGEFVVCSYACGPM